MKFPTLLIAAGLLCISVHTTAQPGPRKKVGVVLSGGGAKGDVVDHGTNRNVLNRQAVAGLDVGALAADDNIADLQAVGSDDVALDTVSVLDQSDECAAVRIVLESLDGSGHIGLRRLLFLRYGRFFRYRVRNGLRKATLAVRFGRAGILLYRESCS